MRAAGQETGDTDLYIPRVSCSPFIDAHIPCVQSQAVSQGSTKGLVEGSGCDTGDMMCQLSLPFMDQRCLTMTCRTQERYS